MQIRQATTNDATQISKLFYDTILTINCKDYNTEQISAWASKSNNITRWTDKITEQYFIVAIDADDIVGFASLTTSGYLDFMFVHKDHQSLGIASKLLTNLESHAQELNIQEINSDVSITAKPFFLQKRFVVQKEQTVNVNGVLLTNFKMLKNLTDHQF